MGIINVQYNDEYFMNKAIEISLQSTCRRQVGAIIVKENKILTSGYNDAPEGLLPCKELDGCIRQINNIPSGTRQEYCRAVHAEQRAIIQAAINEKINIKGGTLYVTTYPCGVCARMIIECKIKRVVYKGDYMDENSHKMLNESKIIVEKYEPSKVIKKELMI